MNLLRTLSLCAAVATSAVSAADQVLVLSAQKHLLHTSASATDGFSSAGLAELAMDALGLGTSTVVPAPPANAVRSPLQADIFEHADAYALVFVEDDGAVLDSVVASTAFTDASYHSVFPVMHRHGAAHKVPDVIAREFATTFGAHGVVQCAGSAAMCSASSLQRAAPADAAAVERVLAANAFLHKNVEADARFAQELAQVSALTASLRTDAERVFYVVGFSDVEALEPSKRSEARNALATQVGAFLSALQTKHSAAGAQIVAAREATPSSLAERKALTELTDVTSYSRLLASLATTPAPASASDDDSGSDDDDDDESDDDVGSSANATTGGNGTSIEKVSLEQIAEYQIVLWTSVLLAATLLLVILAMCNMNTGRDSLLYAKFITDANHRKGD